jgi:hypothetical protein
LETVLPLARLLGLERPWAMQTVLVMALETAMQTVLETLVFAGLG